MPLLDHFRPPLYPARPWESFHAQWAGCIVAWLNAHLPRRFYADAQVHLGARVEADVAEFDAEQGWSGSQNGAAGGVGLLPNVYTPPTLTLPAVFPPTGSVEVRDRDRDRRLVAVVELVSPRNKDRTDARRGFAAKAVGYLEAGVGLVIADLVTDRLANLHDEVAALLGAGAEGRMAGEAGPYVVAYRPVCRNDEPAVDAWPYRCRVGEPLPEVPLALKGVGVVALDLEATYAEACFRNGLS